MKRDTRDERMGRMLMRPILLIGTVAIMLCLVSSGMCDIADDYRREGAKRMREGDYREAVVYLISAHNARPEDEGIKKSLAAAYHNLAIRYASKKDWSGALQNEKKALVNDPDNESIKEQLSLFYNNYALEYASRKRYDLAKKYLGEALEYAPSPDLIKANLYNIVLIEADHEYKNKNNFKAVKLVEEAVSVLPDKDTAYVLGGNIYYQRDKFDDALRYWQKALEINPDNAALHDKIEKLKREKKVEGEFKTKKREHFKIRFESGTEYGYVWSISDMLEDARRKLRSEFRLYSDELIPVIVYSNEQFTQATALPHWTLGLYDGKIRLREQDISKSDDPLRRIIYHEYAHAALYLTYGNNIPVWLHEGFAQLNEPEHPLSMADKRFMASYLTAHGEFSLDDIDTMFARKEDVEAIRAAYLESRIFVMYLIEQYRKHDIKRLLERLKEGMGWKLALKEIYHRTIAQFDEEFKEYLDKALL